MTNDKNLASTTEQGKPKYDNGKGCMMLFILTFIAVAVAVAFILIIGKPQH